MTLILLWGGAGVEQSAAARFGRPARSSRSLELCGRDFVGANVSCWILLSLPQVEVPVAETVTPPTPDPGAETVTPPPPDSTNP